MINLLFFLIWKYTAIKPNK